MSPLFEQPEGRTHMNLRVPVSLKARMNDVVRLWKIQAKAGGGNPGLIDLTFVAVRMMEFGVKTAFSDALALAGMTELPRNEKEWDALEKAISRDAERHPKK